ncbi:cell growth-regulating nucleolar protein [Pseudomyrmex gracilis]|uniref:cell growth-regulating nucleolar protein n=1 Tax=Pseudomyrmex gracilis TaxID=219809 RepID=UPI000994EAB3|nr:cell growth-regulating nucleolar protein [Pseudomyrmex gracilis]
MVVFTCANCGDSVQKPAVAKHYQFKCRSAIFLTCVDCLKDFRGEEYVAHTKCISEAERYGGKDYVPKASANKGERKQQEWLCVVNNLLNGSTELSNAEKNFLNTLSNYENIPRKKAKFLNFIRNAIGSRLNMSVVDSVWDKMETAYKQNQQPIKQTQSRQKQSQKQDNGEMTLTQNTNSDTSLANQENVIENENNENISKEKNSVIYQNGNNKEYKATDNGICEKQQKKSKKRRLKPTDVQSEDNQPAAKVSKAFNVKETKDESDNVPFDWKKIIVDIVQARSKISLKKLQSKTIKKYIHYISTLNENTYELTDEEREKTVAKFNKALKKLKKTSAVIVSEETVQLPN